MQSYLNSAGHNYKCPKCGNFEVGRSPRKNLLDRLLSLVYLYPYRCQYYGCGHRFYRLRR